MLVYMDSLNISLVDASRADAGVSSVPGMVSGSTVVYEPLLGTWDPYVNKLDKLASLKVAVLYILVLIGGLGGQAWV